MQIKSLVPGGQALTTLNNPASHNHGKKIFLWNALPGEIVEDFKLTKQKSSYLEGIATKITHLSKHRTEPKDTCFLSTSPWQIFDYPYELAQKRLLVTESLRQEGITPNFLTDHDLEISPVKTDGKEWHYRNKMEYSLYWDNSDEKIYPAFHIRGTHQKIPLKPLKSPENTENEKALPSSIEHQKIAEKVLKIVQELNNRGEEARKYQSLLLRCNQQGIVSGGLLENYRPHPVFTDLKDSILGKTYSYSPNGFFQINLPVYELALKEIKTFITTDHVLDLYAGVGTIGLSVASDRHLTLVESNKAAFAELAKNAGSLANAFLAKSEDCLSFIEPSQTVILDPPRAGCDKKLINRLLEISPETIIYLSCNPSTQARDVAALLEKYQIIKISPYNFFPKTPHIENLIVLSRK